MRNSNIPKDPWFEKGSRNYKRLIFAWDISKELGIKNYKDSNFIPSIPNKKVKENLPTLKELNELFEIAKDGFKSLEEKAKSECFEFEKLLNRTKDEINCCKELKKIRKESSTNFNTQRIISKKEFKNNGNFKLVKKKKREDFSNMKTEKDNITNNTFFKKFSKFTLITLAAFSWYFLLYLSNKNTVVKDIDSSPLEKNISDLKNKIVMNKDGGKYVGQSEEDLETEFNKSINRDRQEKDSYNRFCQKVINSGQLLAINKHDEYTDYGPPRTYGMSPKPNNKGVWDPNKGKYVFDSKTDYTILWNDNENKKMISIITIYPKVFDKPCIFKTGYLIGENNWSWKDRSNYALEINKTYYTRLGEIILDLSNSGKHLIVYLKHRPSYVKKLGTISRCQYSFDTYDGQLTHWSKYKRHNSCNLKELEDITPYNEWENLVSGKNNPWKSF